MADSEDTILAANLSVVPCLLEANDEIAMPIRKLISRTQIQARYGDESLILCSISFIFCKFQRIARIAYKGGLKQGKGMQETLGASGLLTQRMRAAVERNEIDKSGRTLAEARSQAPAGARAVVSCDTSHSNAHSLHRNRVSTDTDDIRPRLRTIPPSCAVTLARQEPSPHLMNTLVRHRQYLFTPMSG